MMDTLPNDESLFQMFHRAASERMNFVKVKKSRFVHYTRAEAAMHILKSKEIWMRNASCMNDLTEVQHGMNCFFLAYKGRQGQRLKSNLENLFPGICNEIDRYINGWASQFLSETYLTCISEHLDDEDARGRLSMWRAYGKGDGVAIVMNNTPFLVGSSALKAYASPVEYLNQEQFENELEKVVEKIEGNQDFLVKQNKRMVISYVFNMFKFAVLCTKHPGFREECEWRIVYSPKLGESEHLKREIRSISGIPQTIYKIPLRDLSAEGLVGIEIKDLVNRIIIGPTRYARPTAEAFSQILTEAGVENAEQRIFISDIPLR